MNANLLESVTARLINGDIEIFKGLSIKGVIGSLNDDGTWNTPKLLVNDNNNRTERIVYTHHIVTLNFVYKETNQHETNY